MRCFPSPFAPRETITSTFAIERALPCPFVDPISAVRHMALLAMTGVKLEYMLTRAATKFK